MAILELYTLAQQSDESFLEYTGLSKQDFTQLLQYFKTSTAKNSSNEIKLFAICYALKNNLSGEAIGRQLFNANHRRDGENFISKAGSALSDARAKAFPQLAYPVITQPEIKTEVKAEITPPVIASDTASYLGLPDTQSDYILTHAPLNSSGDIYHILAYLILCSHFQKKIPQVMLTYDTGTTEKQANRSHNFAKSLSYSSFFRTERIEHNNAYYEKVRQSQLEKHLGIHYSKATYVDQMATTTIIAKIFLQYGFSTIAKILQKGFSKYDGQYFPKSAQRKVTQYVKDDLNQLNEHENNKPIIILHIRYATSANDHLNIPDSLVVKLITFLNEKGYEAWCVLADDRKKNLPNYASRYISRPFSMPVIEAGTDYSKFQHLQLMTAMAKHDLIQGVIGNTSGTLDACAFVGNKVYNIHQFNDQISYQDLRLNMQCTFLSVEDLCKSALNNTRKLTSEDLIKKALPNFSKWLIKNKEVTPSIRYDNFVIPSMKYGFKKMYNVFMGKSMRPLPDITQFCELITATVSGEERELVHEGKRIQ